MEDSELELRLTNAEKDAAAAKAIAEEALSVSRQALVVQTENESRLKSVQHRMDKIEGKMDTMLDCLAQIRKTTTESNGIQEGTRRMIKIFASLFSACSLVLSVVRVICGI